MKGQVELGVCGRPAAAWEGETMRWILWLVALGVLAQGQVSDRLDVLARQALEASTSRSRLEALDAIAALDLKAAEPGETAKKITALLVLEDLQARAKIVSLLGGLDTQAAFEGLVAATDLQVLEEQRLAADLKLIFGPKGVPLLPTEEEERQQEDLRVRRERASENLVAKRDLPMVRQALVLALAAFRTPAAVAELEKLLAGSLGEWNLTTLEALVGIGCIHALEPALGKLEQLDREWTEAHKSIRKLRKQKPRKKPRKWVLAEPSDEEWERREARRIARELAEAEGAAARLDAWGLQVHGLFDSFAKSRELPRVPKDALPYSNWRSWLRRSRSRLPEHPVGAPTGD